MIFYGHMFNACIGHKQSCPWKHLQSQQRLPAGHGTREARRPAHRASRVRLAPEGDREPLETQVPRPRARLRCHGRGRACERQWSSAGGGQWEQWERAPSPRTIPARPTARSTHLSSELALAALTLAPQGLTRRYERCRWCGRHSRRHRREAKLGGRRGSTGAVVDPSATAAHTGSTRDGKPALVKLARRECPLQRGAAVTPLPFTTVVVATAVLALASVAALPPTASGTNWRRRRRRRLRWFDRANRRLRWPKRLWWHRAPQLRLAAAEADVHLGEAAHLFGEVAGGTSG